MISEHIEDLRVLKKGLQHVVIPRENGFYATKKREVVDKVVYYQLFGYNKFSNEAKIYALLEVSSKPINRVLNMVRQNRYMTDFLKFSELLVKAKADIYDAQRVLDIEYDVLDEIDNVLFGADSDLVKVGKKPETLSFD